MEYQFIKVERQGHVEILRLNDPPTLNAINFQMMHEMAEELRRVEDDPQVRALVPRERVAASAREPTSRRWRPWVAQRRWKRSRPRSKT